MSRPFPAAWALLLFLLPVLASSQSQTPASAPTDRSPVTAAQPSDPLPEPDLTPDAHGALSQQQMEQLFRVVAEKDIANEKKLRDYTYIDREVETRLDGKGNTKSTETRTYEFLVIDGEQVQRLIEKDEKPLSAKEAAKEEEKIQKIIDKHKNESENDRKKRAERDEKEREEGLKYLREVSDAFNFKLVGTEQVGGRDAWVIDGEPRPGFQPHMKYANYLPKFHGRVWIDKSDLQLSKIDLETLDTVSWGLFVARLHKGTRVQLEQTRVNDEVWLPQHLTVKVGVRVALLKNINANIEQSFRDYKKFRTSARIVGMSEVK
ncbi:MAG TPA: hypothetical protein VFO39_10910 [Candidatus Sulfotelmatobacter sp.]|nr:hypothetical protein [Candidatus Sulfotelmatobacter sp.]